MVPPSSAPHCFRGDWVTPDHPDYTQAIARWSATSVRRAAIVAFVKGPDDVAESLDYARKNGLPIAVRGGGHSVNAASSIEGGVVIDLSRYVNTVNVDPENQLAYVGGGALWESVDKSAIDYGLATPGGTVNHVSI